MFSVLSKVVQKQFAPNRSCGGGERTALGSARCALWGKQNGCRTASRTRTGERGQRRKEGGPIPRRFAPGAGENRRLSPSRSVAPGLWSEWEGGSVGVTPAKWGHPPASSAECSIIALGPSPHKLSPYNPLLLTYTHTNSSHTPASPRKAEPPRDPWRQGSYRSPIPWRFSESAPPVRALPQAPPQSARREPAK